MSNKRITDLTELTTPTTDDVFPIVDIATNTTQKVQVGNLPIQTAVTTALATKQDTLVSGTNIKTVNSTSLVGSGNVAVQETLVSGTNIKTLNSVSLLGSGNIVLAASPSGVAGAIQFSNGSAFASDAANLFWDDTNNRLGVGTNTPNATLQVVGNAFFQYGGGSADGLLQVGTNQGGIILTSANRPEIQLGTSARMTTRGTGITFRTTTGEPNGAVVGVVGSGSTSATTSLLVQNSSGTQLFKIDDSGNTSMGGSGFSSRFNIVNINGSIAAFFAGSGNGGVVEFNSSSGAGIRFNDGYGNTNMFVAGLSTPSVSMGKTTAAVASALLEMESTTKGFLPPRMTTTQKNAIATPAAGLVVYDSTTNKLCCYNGSTWNDLF